MITVGEIEVGQHFRADVVWMDERPLDPSRVYLLKHTTRTVTAEVDRSWSLNQIGSVKVTTARPVMIDSYVENRGTGSFIIDRSDDEFHGGRRDDCRSAPRGVGRGSGARPSAAARLARVARRRRATTRRSRPCGRRSRRSSTDLFCGVGSLDPTDTTPVRAGLKTGRYVRSTSTAVPCATSTSVTPGATSFASYRTPMSALAPASYACSSIRM